MSILSCPVSNRQDLLCLYKQGCYDIVTANFKHYRLMTKRIDMIYGILDNIMIIVLSCISIPCSISKELFILLATLLMITAAYQSLEPENERKVIVIQLPLMLLYSVLSGWCFGFLIFMLAKRLPWQMRILVGVLLYIPVSFFVYKRSAAAVIINILLLILAFMLLTLIYRVIDILQRKNRIEHERVVASNIGELHAKRLNEQLALQSYVTEKNARLVERENISRNIHNSVGHSITAAIMTLEAADVLFDVKPEDARKKMNDANNRIRGSLESIRRAVRVLDEDSTGIPAGDLLSEIDMIIKEFIMDTDITVNQNSNNMANDMEIPHDHAVFLVGTLQELLTNGVKHGGATEFTVILDGDSAHVRLVVTDNGHSDFNDINGAKRIEDGFGIRKIAAYAEKCGGKAKFGNYMGFRAEVELPVIFEK